MMKLMKLMQRTTNTKSQDLGLLALRLTTGGLLAGHGAQKLFGSFGGYGLDGTAGWLESLGLRPGKTWALMAGGGEFASGVMMSLGFLHPLGAISSVGPMAMAWAVAHAGKPIWVTSGGAELPLTNLAVATAVGLAGPGRYSLDEALGIKVPTSVVVGASIAVAAGVMVGLMTRQVSPAEEEDLASGQLQAGEDAGDEQIDTELAPNAIELGA
jgi:putative oxidoreductase